MINVILKNALKSGLKERYFERNGDSMTEIKKSDFFEVGRDGVKKILTPDDKKIDIIEFDDKKLCYVKSGMGYPAIYPMHETHFEKKAEVFHKHPDRPVPHFLYPGSE